MRRAISCASLVLFIAGCAAGVPPQPSVNEPGLARGLASADSTVQAAVGKLTAGAVLVVSKDGRVVHQRAFGLAQIKSQDCFSTTLAGSTVRTVVAADAATGSLPLRAIVLGDRG